MIMCAKGSVAGNYNAKDPYIVVHLNYNKIPAHIIVWALHNGPIQSANRVDHFNQDKRDNRISNLREIPAEMNSRNCPMFKNNKSGVTGVCKRQSRKTPSWSATWVDISGAKKEKSFPVSKYGEELAFELACKYREQMLHELNLHGLGYTPQHGKVKSQETSHVRSSDD